MGTPVVVSFAMVAALAAAPAQESRSAELLIDGLSSVRDWTGEPLSVAVRGEPGEPVILFIDLKPGARSGSGLELPLAFSPATRAVLLGVTDADGRLETTLPGPSTPITKPMTLYFAASIGGPKKGNNTPTFTASADVLPYQRNADLAGNSLAAYPFFEHVSAFNEGSTVQLGVDPSRFPVVVGKTADIYVVASKTRTEWNADASLTDVAGGPIQFTFGAANIQANTVTVDAGTLSGNTGGTGMGVPYDLVIDFDQDGILNNLDLIDGYSNQEAGFYVVHDLTQAGPLAVTELTYQLIEVPFTFNRQNTYYPTNIASMGKLPLVVISHGNGHNFQWYDHIGNHLASYGYIVMSHENDTVPGTVTAAQSTVENTEWFFRRLPTIGGGALVNHVDETRIVWIGHSRGGEGVVRAYDMLLTGAYVPTQYTASSIQLISSIAPVDFGGSVPPMGEPTTSPQDVNYSPVGRTGRRGRERLHLGYFLVPDPRPGDREPHGDLPVRGRPRRLPQHLHLPLRARSVPDRQGQGTPDHPRLRGCRWSSTT